MEALAAGAALGVLIGLAALLRAPDARVAVLGLGLVLLAAPLLAPTTSPGGLGFRVVSAVMATFLLWRVVRDAGVPVGRPALGGTVEIVFIVLAAMLGAVAGPDLLAGPASTPVTLATVAALASTLAIGLAAADLLLFPTDALRQVAGALLALSLGDAVLRTLAGAPPATGELAWGLLLLASGLVGARLVGAQIAARGDLGISARPHEVPGA